MIYIFQKFPLHQIYEINGDISDLDKDFDGKLTEEELQSIYPEYNSKTMTYTDKKVLYPVMDINGNITERTDYDQMKIEGIIPLEDGEYIEDGVLKRVNADLTKYVKPVWVPEQRQYIETATQEEICLEYYNQIDLRKAELLVNGYDWTDIRNGSVHHQKYRVDPDIARLNQVFNQKQMAVNARLSGIKVNMIKTDWAFSDADVYTIDEVQFESLYNGASCHLSKCYYVEQTFKKSYPYVPVTLADLEDLYNRLIVDLGGVVIGVE